MSGLSVLGELDDAMMHQIDPQLLLDLTALEDCPT